MSSFFSLGGAFEVSKDEQQNDPNHQENSVITPNSLYLFKNEEIYTKGFELWQQYYHLHHHPHRQPPPSPPSHYDNLGVAGVCNRRNNTADLSLNSNNNNNNSWNFVSRSIGTMRQASYGLGGGDHGGSGGSGSGSGGINCQDCGNQAKKDCQHMRCRTCCKSRGFQCQTHIKSTWVPAAKRRERQQQLAALTHQQHNLGTQQLSLMMRGTGSGSIDQNPKRLREDHQILTTTTTAALNLPATHHHNTSSGLEVGHFPAEVNSPAVFRCVRVSAMDDAEEQLAYQTAVNIGGHLFKGILYDHGPGGGGGGDSSSTGGGGGGVGVNLITSGTIGFATPIATATATAATSTNPNVGSMDPSSIYPTPLNAFMAGTQFFPPPRS